MHSEKMQMHNLVHDAKYIYMLFFFFCRFPATRLALTLVISVSIAPSVLLGPPLFASRASAFALII